MGYYIIAVGGTGNKILESAVYAAAADAFHKSEQDDPIPLIHMLSVDVDAACGNTTRAKQAADCYSEVLRALKAELTPHRCFHTRIELKQWNINLNRRSASLQQMTQVHSSDRMLADLLFTEQEKNLSYGEGFRGHPNLGVLFFGELLSSLEELRQSGQRDEFNDMLDLIDEELSRGETVHLALCGSIFGGTGASGVPAISRFLQKRYESRRQNFIMGAVLLLPYYNVPGTQSKEGEIVVESSAFIDKARTALQYYGMGSMMRDGEDDRNGVLDALYLLGVPPEQFISARNYSTGSASQENDAHLLEWLASRCLGHFFRGRFRGAQCGDIDCYYYQLNQGVLDWQSFDSEGSLYMDRYGSMLKSAMCYCTECYATLSRWVLTGDQDAGRINYCAAFFHQARKMGASKRSQLNSTLDALYRFFCFYVNWLSQLLDNLPPFLRAADSDTDASVKKRKNAKTGLVNKRLLALFQEYLVLSAEHNSPRGEILAEELQRGFQQLIRTPAADRHGWSYLMRRMGSGPSHPGSCFGTFLCTLLAAVMED